MKVKKIFIIITILFYGSLITAQTEFSVHKYHKKLYQNKISEHSYNSASQNQGVIIPLQKKQKAVNKIIFGYLPDWEYLANSHKYIQFDLLTHIVYFDFPADSNGNLKNPAGWPWTSLMNDAHVNGVKNILGVTNFEANEIRRIITNSTARTNFFNQIKNKVSVYNFDGVNIDFEGLYNADKSSVINGFMKSLTDSMHSWFPESEVSFAGPVINWGNYWNLNGLAASCDYIFIMGYAFAGSWNEYTSANSPLTGTGNTITSALNKDYATAISNYPERIILGLPYYGVQWTTETGNAYSPTIDFIANPKYRNAILKAESNGKLWDENSKTVWTRWKDAEWNQIWFDDDSSLGLKYDLTLAKNIGGIGMWALGYDGDRTELWNLIAEKFGSGSSFIPSKPTAFYIISEEGQEITLNFNLSSYADFYEVYKSTDAKTFVKSGDYFSSPIVISNLNPDSIYFFKIRAGNSSGFSDFTELLLANNRGYHPRILLVNGFDRVSGTINNFDAVKFWLEPLIATNAEIVSTSNEAVIQGKVRLEDFDIVIWILLDESTEDETFSAVEQMLIANYLDNGGKFFVSGSEIGWDLVEKGSTTDKEFYKKYLKAKYISDAPNNQSKTYYTLEVVPESFYAALNENTFNFDNGTHGSIDVDWPDAIEPLSDSTPLFKYKNTNNYAGVAYWGLFSLPVNPGKVIYFSFPFESIYPAETRKNVWEIAYSYLSYEPTVSQDINYPKNFSLSQNYPNPFNSETIFEYFIPENENKKSENVQIIIYDMLGQVVEVLVDKKQSSGIHNVKFSAKNLPSGVYFYQVKTDRFSATKKMILLR